MKDVDDDDDDCLSTGFFCTKVQIINIFLVYFYGTDWNLKPRMEWK